MEEQINYLEGKLNQIEVDYQIQITKIKLAIDELKKTRVKIKKEYLPKENYGYFYIKSAGYVDKCRIDDEEIDNDDDAKNFRYKNHNLFEKEKDAEKYLELIKIKNRIQEIADELNNYEDIDWCIAKKYVIQVFLDNKCNKQVSVLDMTHRQLNGQIYFKSEELAQKAIEKIKQEIGLKNFIKMVESGV